MSENFSSPFNRQKAIAALDAAAEAFLPDPPGAKYSTTLIECPECGKERYLDNDYVCSECREQV